MPEDIKNINNDGTNKRYMSIKGAKPRRHKKPIEDNLSIKTESKSEQQGLNTSNDLKSKPDKNGLDETKNTKGDDIKVALDEPQNAECNKVDGDSLEQSLAAQYEDALTENSESTPRKGFFRKRKKALTFDEKYNPEKLIPKVLKAQIREYATINDFDRQAIEKADKIGYRAPFSYRFIRIAAMIFVLLPFILIRILLDVPDDEGEGFILAVVDIVDFLQGIALPLFLLAAFCFVLNKPREVRGRLIVYFIFAVAVYVGIILAFYRYAIPLLEKFDPSIIDAGNFYAEANRRTIASFGSVINYNIFIDLFLCTLFFFFTNYTPKNLSGKKLKLFRACAIIPVLYVLISVILFGLFSLGAISLDIWQFALLTCRSPASYIVFFSLSLFLAYRKNKYLQRGGTVAGYNIYTKTRASSLQFSIFCSIVLAVVALIDFLFSLIPGAEIWMIGDSYNMVFIIPFVMLLSYSKDYTNKTLDSLLPFLFISSILFLILDISFCVALRLF